MPIDPETGLVVYPEGYERPKENDIYANFVKPYKNMERFFSQFKRKIRIGDIVYYQDSAASIVKEGYTFFRCNGQKIDEDIYSVLVSRKLKPSWPTLINNKTSFPQSTPSFEVTTDTDPETIMGVFNAFINPEEPTFGVYSTPMYVQIAFSNPVPLQKISIKLPKVLNGMIDASEFYFKLEAGPDEDNLIPLIEEDLDLEVYLEEGVSREINDVAGEDDRFSVIKVTTQALQYLGLHYYDGYHAPDFPRVMNEQNSGYYYPFIRAL